LILRLLIFTLVGYLAARSFGSCPIRWRKSRYWLLLIIVAGAYWVEYLMQFIPTIEHTFTYRNVVIDMAGALLGIVIRLRSSYQKCRCRYIVQEGGNPQHQGWPYNTGGFVHLGHNPSLPPIIAKSFGWRALEIRKPGFTLGVICTGKGLVSYPHLSYGNIQFTRELEPCDHADLLEHYLNRTPFASVEVRLTANEITTSADNHKVVSLLHLDVNPWQRFTSNLRRKIRRSQKNGFTIVQGGMALLDDFYKVYATHIRSLGSAPLTRRWFKNLLQQYSNGFCGIFLLKKGDELAGAAFNLEYQGFYENSYFAVSKPHQKTYGSYALTYAMIQHAQAIGAHTYSFGRSTPNSGVHRFKQQWSTTDLPLVWLKSTKPPVNLRQFTWLNTLWKTLPNPLRKPLDPYISKWVY
jgi:hypothetical protein